MESTRSSASDRVRGYLVAKASAFQALSIWVDLDRGGPATDPPLPLDPTPAFYSSVRRRASLAPKPS